MFKFLILLIFVSCSWKIKNDLKSANRDVPKEPLITPAHVEKVFKIDKKQAKKFTITKKKIKSVKKSNKVKQIKLAKKKERYPEFYPELFKKKEERNRKLWKEVNPKYLENETHILNIKYVGITAGRLKMSVMADQYSGDQTLQHLRVQLVSAPFYKFIYSIEDTIDAFSEKKTLLPVKYTLFQKESRQNVSDLQIFDREELKTYFKYHRIKEGKEKKVSKESFIPYYSVDSFTALYFVRSLPLKNGYKFEFPVITRGKVWFISGEVLKTEMVSTKAGRINSYKIKVETKFPGVLKKHGDIFFWISADEQKKLVKFDAKVKIGSVTGELSQYSAQ